jgi:hypothetical protein
LDIFDRVNALYPTQETQKDKRKKKKEKRKREGYINDSLNLLG